MKTRSYAKAPQSPTPDAETHEEGADDYSTPAKSASDHTQRWFSLRMKDEAPRRENDDSLLYRKRYKIIVGSATDMHDLLSYRN